MVTDDRCKLFVAGLPDSISEPVLRQLFEATGGSVVDVSVPRDRATGRTRGFAFVTMSSEVEARGARESLDGSMQSGRSISVRPFQAAPPKRGDAPRGDAPPDRGGGGGGGGGEDRTLYLGNLPYDASLQEVEQMLERAGASSVVRVNLPLDPQGRPRGFGFVSFGSAEAAQSAVDALREAELKGRRISASIAHARGERPARPFRPPMGGGGPPPPRAPRNDGPRWGNSDFGGGPPPAPTDDSDDRRGDGRRRSGGGGGGGPKDAGKKKRGRGAAERGRTRRDGEGLRAPRARDRYEEDDDEPLAKGKAAEADDNPTPDDGSADPDEK
jgi:RNA recognition motif-containing protein